MVISRSTRSHVRVSIGSPSVQSEKPLRTCCHNSFNIWGLKCVRREVGHNLFLLRSNGVTVPFPGGVIPTLAIATDLEVWTSDQHYQFIQRILPTLKLFQAPP